MSLRGPDGARYAYPEWDIDSDPMPEGSLLFLSDSRGVYIPQHFAQSVDFANMGGIDPADWAEIERGPDHEWYWEAWAAICDNGTVRSPDSGKVYALYQDGDFWLIPLERVTL